MGNGKCSRGADRMFKASSRPSSGNLSLSPVFHWPEKVTWACSTSTCQGNILWRRNCEATWNTVWIQGGEKLGTMPSATVITERQVMLWEHPRTIHVREVREDIPKKAQLGLKSERQVEMKSVKWEVRNFQMKTTARAKSQWPKDTWPVQGF